MRTRHPRALYFLALVQMWERFAFFATLPLFVLYLQQHRGFSSDAALLLFGSFQAASYLSGLPAGYLADRWLGHRLATLLGAVLLTLGYCALAIDRHALLWPALGLMIAGHGLFKTSLHTIAGSLYTPSDPKREGGFMLLHLVFNAGATVGPLIAEWARARWGWSAVFQCAALGMLASTVSFGLGLFAFKPMQASIDSPTSPRLDSQNQRERIWACLLVCAVGVVFWLSAMQAGTSLALFAEQNTDGKVPVWGRWVTVGPGHFMSLHSLLVLVIMPPLGWMLSRLRRRGAEPSTPAKMVWGFVATAGAFAVMGMAGIEGGDAGHVSIAWLASCYVLLTIGELLLSPIGLSLITRLAPPRMTSQMIGLWFAATAVGTWLAGGMGLMWNRWPHHQYFGVLALLALGAAGLLLSKMRRVERLLAAKTIPAAGAPSKS